MDLQRLKFLMDVQEKIDEWDNKLPINDTNLLKAKEQFFKLVTNEFKKKVNANEIQETPKIDKIALDTNTIRQVLEIRADVSINFDFIENTRVRNQLVIDNLRMENARLDVQKSDLERFHEFCVNAFYQIEELINYYYSKKVEKNNIIWLLQFIEDQLKEKNKKAQDDSEIKNKNLKEGEVPKKPYKTIFYRNDKEMINVSKIDINIKLTTFTHSFKFDFGNEILSNNLRQLRNEESHRCTVIIKMNTGLAKFLEKRAENYDKIRQLIILICKIIEKDLTNNNL